MGGLKASNAVLLKARADYRGGGRDEELLVVAAVSSDLEKAQDRHSGTPCQGRLHE